MAKTTNWARREYDSWRAKPVGCAVCGKPTGEPTSHWMGNRRVDGWSMPTMYCSNACRQKAYRARRKAQLG